MAKTMPRLLLLLAVTTSLTAMADGVDDSRFYESTEPQKQNHHADPNYWSDFDKHPCDYPVGPTGFVCRNKTRIEYIPNAPDADTGQTKNISVPEPNPELLLLMGLTALLIKHRFKK
jgi:hypothetical protein